MNPRWIALVAALVAAFLFFQFDLQQYLRFTTLKQSYVQLLANYESEPLLFIVGFMALQIAALTLCLPGAVLTMALAGGAIFGFALGTIILLTSLTIGDSLGFLLSRFLIGNWVRKRFASQLEEFEAEIDRNGGFYLLSLRLLAAIPYFVINLTFGVTRMRLRTFAPVSFAGLAPATALYVNAGTGLSTINSPGDVLSTRIVVSFALLALIPLIGRYFLGRSARQCERG